MSAHFIGLNDSTRKSDSHRPLPPEHYPFLPARFYVLFIPMLLVALCTYHILYTWWLTSDTHGLSFREVLLHLHCSGECSLFNESCGTVSTLTRSMLQYWLASMGVHAVNYVSRQRTSVS